MNKNVTPEILKEFKAKLVAGELECNMRRWFKHSTKLSKSQSNEVFNQTKREILNQDTLIKESSNWGQELDFNGEVTYNKDLDVYILFLNKLNKNITLKGEVVRDIQRSFSDLLGEPATINELARAHGIPRHFLTEIIKKLGLTHSELPLTEEEIQDKSVEEISSDLLELKKFKIVQEFNKKDWRESVTLANKWREFENNQFNPFVKFLEKWQPPEYKSIKLENRKLGKNHFIVSVSDIHVGSFANKRYNYFKDGWQFEDLEISIKKYVNKIRLEVEDRKSGFESANLIMLGDILHGLLGFTDKGTKLEARELAEEQFDLAFNLLTYFINELLTIFPSISVYSVCGNHSSFGDYVVAHALSVFYRNEKRIKFDVSTKRYTSFRLYDYLFLCEHGYSAFYKSRLPKSGPSRENYINTVFLAKPELLQGIKQKYFLTADQHHFEGKETNSYEHYMFSTPVAGDRHSDNCGYNNRPRQNCLIVDENGVKEILSIYFD